MVCRRPATPFYAVDSGTGAHVMTAPDGTVYKEFYGSNTTYQRTLPVRSEFWSSGTMQKWTTTNWTQDNTGVGYLINPRVTESNIYDSASNHRRTTFGFYAYTRASGGLCTLPSDTYEYKPDPNSNILYRHTHLGWQLDSGYLARGFSGLLHDTQVFDASGGTEVLVTHSSFWYDYGGELLAPTNASDDTLVVQHDPSFNTSFQWRGNVALAIKYDAVNDPNNANNTAQQVLTAHNSSGSVIFTRDPLYHQTSVSYPDSFSDSVNRNTFAYPTTVTNAGGSQSFAKYNFDFGAKTQVKGPAPDGQSQGVIQNLAYDGAGRLQQSTNANTGAYARYVYGPTYIQTYASVNNAADEA